MSYELQGWDSAFYLLMSSCFLASLVSDMTLLHRHTHTYFVSCSTKWTIISRKAYVYMHSYNHTIRHASNIIIVTVSVDCSIIISSCVYSVCTYIVYNYLCARLGHTRQMIIIFGASLSEEYGERKHCMHPDLLLSVTLYVLSVPIWHLNSPQEWQSSL